MHILALVEAPGHVCCRYRIAAFEPWLDRFGVQITYQQIEKSPLSRLRQMQAATEFDSVILQRRLLDPLSFRALRKAARHLVFDFDDAVVYRDSYAARGHHCPRRKVRFEQVVKGCDTILAGNNFLASLAEGHGASGPSVHYMPTCVDLAAYERTRSDQPATTDDRLVMVWIGSSSTLKGIEATTELWERVGRKVENISFRVVCDRFPKFQHLAVEPVRWSEATEIENIVRADIGISHVPDDLWSRGKCGLKVLQYLAGGLPVLTNPVGVHREMISQGSNGFLVSSNDEWLEAIRWLAGNPETLTEMGMAGLETIRHGYDVADWGPFFVDRVAPGAVPIDFDRINHPEKYASSLSAGKNWKFDSPGTSGPNGLNPASVRSERK